MELQRGPYPPVVEFEMLSFLLGDCLGIAKIWRDTGEKRYSIVTNIQTYWKQDYYYLHRGLKE